jgi:hypothetical protein
VDKTRCKLYFAYICYFLFSVRLYMLKIQARLSTASCGEKMKEMELFAQVYAQKYIWAVFKNMPPYIGVGQFLSKTYIF